MKTVTHQATSSFKLDASIQKTLIQTFLTIGGMWALTALSSFVLRDFKPGLVVLLVLFATSIGALYAIQKFKDSAIGLGLLAAFSLIQGATLGPLLAHYLSFSGGAQLVATSAGLTAVATGACAGYCLHTKKSFSRMRSFLFAGLIALLVASVVGLIFPTPLLHLVISAAACLLFTAYLLYDLGEVISGNERNYITAATGIYLSMLNIFTSLLRLLGILGSSND
jgi:modulator of FtsH protease